MTTQNDLIQIFKLFVSLEQRLEQLESHINEQRDFIVNNAFPDDPFEGQVTLRTDLQGTNGGGTLFRYDTSTSVWIEI